LSATKTTICLNMIVKDEAPVIQRCLENVAPLIDHWVIVDTGSKDGTQEIITETFANKPGSLHERPWVNFGHNRTEAIRLATGKADYILTLDADELLERSNSFAFGALTADAYMLPKRRGNREYRVPNLVRSDCNWRWEGVLHEQPASDTAEHFENIDGVIIVSRTVFYLAQSYRDADDYDLAIRYYRQRTDMGGWREEIFVSLYQIARIMMLRGDPWPLCLEAYLAAHAHTSKRVEPLYEIGMEYASQENWPLASLFLERARCVTSGG